MISLLQSRISQYLRPVATPPPAPPPSETSTRATSTPRLTESRNATLRTLGGASEFDAAPARTSQRAAEQLGAAAPAAAGSLSNHDAAAEDRQEAVERAIAGNGEPVDLVNSDGKTEQVSIGQLPLFGNENTYFVRVGDESFSVEFEGGTHANRQEFLAQVIDFYSETPPELRDSLDHIKVTPDEGSTTATGGSAAASAGDGTITFYDDGQHLSGELFHHELAHLIGRSEENENDGWLDEVGEEFKGEPPPVPNGWEEAAEADGNHVSDYSKADYEQDENYTEDFAEAWAQYMEAIDAGPEALAEFKAEFPERAEILEELYSPPA